MFEFPKYHTHEVLCCVRDDPWGVRDEGFRRQALAEKKILRIRKSLAVAMKEMADAQAIIEAGMRSIAEQHTANSRPANTY